jgi:hypothetical protein
MTDTSFNFNDAHYWRGRAEEARAIARNMSSAMNVEIMEGIANDFERLAQHAEARTEAERTSVEARQRRGIVDKLLDLPFNHARKR